jgi:hypothetical protein
MKETFRADEVHDVVKVVDREEEKFLMAGDLLLIGILTVGELQATEEHFHLTEFLHLNEHKPQTTLYTKVTEG